MSYIDKTLARDEHVVVRGKWPTIYWVLAWAALIVLGWIIVGVFIFAKAAVTMMTTEFGVTDRRVVVKRGWLNVHTQELAVESVESVELEQNFWQRIWGYGRLHVTGTGDATIAFPPMAHPVQFRRAIENGRGREGEVHIAREDLERLAAQRARAEEAEAPRHEKRGRRFVGLTGR